MRNTCDDAPENKLHGRVVILWRIHGATGALAFPAIRDVDCAKAEAYLSWATTKKTEL
jgi:hypothetical protein